MDNKTVTLYALFESELKVVEIEARETAKCYIFEKRSRYTRHLLKIPKNNLVKRGHSIKVIARSREEAISTFVDILVSRQRFLHIELVRVKELLEAVEVL